MFVAGLGASLEASRESTQLPRHTSPRISARRASAGGLGIGRIGAILGPYLGGTLMGLKWPVNQLFFTAAIPALLSSVVMMAMSRAMKEQKT